MFSFNTYIIVTNSLIIHFLEFIIKLGAVGIEFVENCWEQKLGQCE